MQSFQKKKNYLEIGDNFCKLKFKSLTYPEIKNKKQKEISNPRSFEMIIILIDKLN